jgi:hypothetical protein
MSSLPRVTAATRERVSREFDDLGPTACTAQVVQFLERSNPEFLDMVLKCARDLEQPDKTMVGFAMFYRLLAVESFLAEGGIELHTLPRVAPETRDLLVTKIDEEGPEAFAMEAIDNLEQSNPELLQMVHAFASRHPDYLGVMQGFGLLYQALVLQLSGDRARAH